LDRMKIRKVHTLESNKVCSGFHSKSGSSWFELVQLSVLFLFGVGEPKK
jgi:hypothetical protein